MLYYYIYNKMSNNKTKTKKKTFFENYDLYSDANPEDTIRIKYKTLQDVKDTIKKLEKLYKNCFFVLFDLINLFVLVILFDFLLLQNL